MADDEDFQPLCKRFRCARTVEEEQGLLDKAIPISTRYKNNWAVSLFHAWKQSRENKSAALEATSLKEVDIDNVQDLESELVKLTPVSLNLWIGKFIQEVRDKNGQRYPGI